MSRPAPTTSGDRWRGRPAILLRGIAGALASAADGWGRGGGVSRPALMRAGAAGCLLLAFAPAPDSHAQRIDRLFSTPEQRAVLDGMRDDPGLGGKPAPAAAAAKPEPAADADPESMPDPAAPAVTINGIVLRGGVQRVSWINGVAVDAGAAAPGGIRIDAGRVPDGRFRVRLPDGRSTIDLKPGQKAGVVKGRVLEAELVVGPVHDVGPVRLALLARRLPRNHHPHRHAEEPVDLPHPVGVAAGEVVVEGDDVDAVPAEGVQVGGQGRHQGLPLAGAHLRDPALVEHEAADELHVEMAHLERAPPGLAHDRERFGDQGVERLPGRPPGAQALGDGGELGVVPAPQAGLQRVDRGHRAAIPAQQTLVARPDHPAQDVRHHVLSSS